MPFGWFDFFMRLYDMTPSIPLHTRCYRFQTVRLGLLLPYSFPTQGPELSVVFRVRRDEEVMSPQAVNTLTSYKVNPYQIG